MLAYCGEVSLLASSILFLAEWQKIIPSCSMFGSITDTVLPSPLHSIAANTAPSNWPMEAFQLHPKPVKLWKS